MPSAASFIPRCYRFWLEFLKPGAEWRVASDDPTYQAWVRDLMASQAEFTAGQPATTRPDGWPPTRYEAKALEAGRQPLYWTFQRREGFEAGGRYGSNEL